MRILAFIIILNISLNSRCFFWVPNRYTAPYWSGDTHITMQSIGSVDIYIDRATQQDNTIQYYSTNSGLALYQTISSGFFLEATIPTTIINFKEHSKQFTHQKGGMCYENSTVLFGWCINYDQIPYLDFIDCMLRTGCIMPAHQPLNDTGHTESLYGYHEWGIPSIFDASIGFCEWILCGFHASICTLHNTPIIYHMEPYFKADHLMRGFSFWIAYSYTGAAERDIGSAFFFDNSRWQMHTMHYGIEFECIQYAFPLHPRIAAYYNQCIGGNNIFKQNHLGITAGLDIIW